MSVLISDKSVPFASALAGALRGKNSSVAMLSGEQEAKTAKTDKSASDSSALIEIPWNRSSALSARTVLLEVKNKFVTLEQAVLVFDTPFLTETAPEKLATVTVVDDFIKGFLLLVSEITVRFALEKKGRLVFVVRQQATGTNAFGIQNIPVRVAESAFIRLAEETALAFSARSNIDLQTLLVKLETAGDAENAAWLLEQMEQPSVSRNQTRWIKSGSHGLFGKM